MRGDAKKKERYTKGKREGSREKKEGKKEGMARGAGTNLSAVWASQRGCVSVLVTYSFSQSE